MTSTPRPAIFPSPELGLANRRDELLDQILELVLSQELPATADRQCIDNFLQCHSKAQIREVSVLLADLRGFTSLAESRPAEDVVKILNIFFRRMNSVIQRYGGLIDKYMGDAILAVFGVGANPEEHALRAVTCAIAMQIEMEAVNAENLSHGFPEIFTGIGVNSDIVSAGLLGSELHSEYSVIDNGVNLASRIECHCLRGQVLISDQTLTQTGEALDVDVVNRVRVKGKAEPVDLYEVIGLKGDSSMTVPRREIRKNIRVELSADIAFQILQDKQVLPEIHKAKITSVRQLADGYGYGIEFTSIDEDSQQVINDLVNRLVSGH